MSRCALVLLLVSLASGCGFLRAEPKGKSLLTALELGSDSSALEVTFVRLPTTDKQLPTELWQHLDEQQISPALRRELAQAGFRVGILGSHTPPALARLLESAEAAPTTAVEMANKLDIDQPVKKRRLQMHAGRRHDVIASSVYEQLPVLMHEDGGLRGRTYYQAQGLLVLKAFPQGEGGVRLEITPEVQHGQARQQYVGDEGMWRFETARPKHLFERLMLQASLAPGQSLVLSHQPDRPGSLGHYFFTEPASGGVQSKLVILRLGATTRDDLYQPAAASEVQAKPSKSKKRDATQKQDADTIPAVDLNVEVVDS